MIQASAEAAPAAARTRHALLGTRASYWLAAGAALALLVPAAERAATLLAYNLLLLLLWAWDYRQISAAPISTTRTAPSRLRAGTSGELTLTLIHTRGPTLRIVLEQAASSNLMLTPQKSALSLSTREPHVLPIALQAPHHGIGELTELALRIETRWGLAACIERHTTTARVRVYPDVPLGRRSLSSLERKELGTAPQRMLDAGHGTELSALREYVPNDPQRSIDWKATARRLVPITRTFQPERSQTLWIVIDASRAMTLPWESDVPAPNHDAPTRFEAALCAALELADAALTSGDRVGFLVYGRTALLSALPKRGRAQLLHIAERSLTVQPQATELDAEGLTRTLLRLAPKRALLMLFTDLDNEGDLRIFAEHLPLLTRRHLTGCMTLPAARLRKTAASALNDDESVYRKVAALNLLEQRKRLARALRDGGMPVQECAAPELARRALRRYREIKLSGRL